MQIGQLPTLTFNWHKQLASAINARTLLFMYMTGARVCVYVYRDSIWRSDGIIYTHKHCLSVASCLWYEYGEARAEGSVTLGQGDRSGQVWLCEYTLVCQRFVPGQQVASQRTSVTFSLSLPQLSFLCPSLPVSLSPHSSHLLASTLSLHNKSRAHSEDEYIHRCGWFIHELVLDAVFTQCCWIM